MSDGELNEGNIWEAAMFASKYKLSNITGISKNLFLYIFVKLLGFGYVPNNPCASSQTITSKSLFSTL